MSKRSSSPTLKPGKKPIHPFFTNSMNTIATVASDIAKNQTSINWEVYDTSLLVGSYKFPTEFSNSLNKLLLLDLDNTVIKVKGKNKMPVGRFDWIFLNSKVKSTLKEYSEKEYQLIILSNQLKLMEEDKKFSDFKLKVEDIFNEVDIPVLVLAATKKDQYRKPNTGFIDYLKQRISTIDWQSSKFVGDAAGREANFQLNLKKDFADTDLKFALNANIQFQTPEQFYYNYKDNQHQIRGFQPKVYLKNIAPIETKTKQTLLEVAKFEVIMLVGYPASGKSTLTHKIFANLDYNNVNQDTLKTKAKCLKVMEELLSNNKKVVIDNTNPDINSRKPYLDLCKKYNKSIVAVHLQTELDLAYHNNLYRALYKKVGQDLRNPIEKVVFYTYRKNFILPSLKEGFTKVVQIDFVPQFHNDTEKENWSKFLS